MRDGIAVLRPIVFRVAPGASVCVYQSLIQPKVAFGAHPLQSWRTSRLPASAASPSWMRSYAPASHFSSAESAHRKNAAGRLPAEPKFPGRKLIWYFRSATRLGFYGFHTDSAFTRGFLGALLISVLPHGFGDRRRRFGRSHRFGFSSVFVFGRKSHFLSTIIL